MPLDSLTQQPADGLLALMSLYAADPRRTKLDLGVGVYRTEAGVTPVMVAVKQAEQRLVAIQTSKSYLGPEGDVAFVHALKPVVFGDALTAELGARLTGLQTVGGTGALRLAADLIASASPGHRLWLGTPSWPNHAPVFAGGGLQVRTYRQFDAATQRFDLDATLEALGQAHEGDVVLLHGCCHNPTGADPSAAQWDRIIEVLLQRGLVPLIDMAYQGLGQDLDGDAWALRRIASRVPQALVAYSCDKNFGLYRERVGALYVVAARAAGAEAALSHLAAHARASYSMPADHGAAVVRTILADAVLRAQWSDELRGMAARVASIRQGLSALGRIGPVDLTSLARQRGLFALLPLAPAAIERLRVKHGVYMAGNGRINIAGLAQSAVGQFGDALRAAQTAVAA
ncbi:amino acid aminotransferase [Pseudoxanthomonas winnipegensis]|uniref:Aspartate/tyrosine/aromatic aminotransferase n=1 Tax=Pseudoxanthomonas winnipegensis TaxID=2480810 RepID=A0A4Q8LK10_9GAMM|nr:amino acid aminotransferase [Pseudoxanthomonas winnipegensis]RZZ82632.1 aspartate/tyrosine/aromatic aminotransferase [Pseudoxanthomonas winnipegensis]TAA30591.1 aspartate/tyrosine/aromatic aminotransferase [Pseudoxanthomonas winnipegensis]